ncbi:MAG: hypothetical protein Athens071424_14 [Parcubacteria group bacterium Athens0714_24]|nr:MAG: hypothetical protein Athens071424_14 [Parcubacteria group bacterium Athens0714_24]
MFIKKLFKNNNFGFTIIETIVALGLGVLVVTAVTTIVLPGLKNIRAATQTERLHANAVFLLNNLTYWIKQAEDLNTPSPSVLEIKLSDSSVKIIKKDGDNITADNIPLNNNDVKIIELNFTKMAKSVKIDLVIKTEKGETFSIKTTIAQRNKL